METLVEMLQIIHLELVIVSSAGTSFKNLNPILTISSYWFNLMKMIDVNNSYLT